MLSALSVSAFYDMTQDIDHDLVVFLFFLLELCLFLGVAGALSGALLFGLHQLLAQLLQLFGVTANLLA